MISGIRKLFSVDDGCHVQWNLLWTRTVYLWFRLPYSYIVHQLACIYQQMLYARIDRVLDVRDLKLWLHTTSVSDLNRRFI